jgi:transcriptional regulator with XRE-family HTH domain
MVVNDVRECLQARLGRLLRRARRKVGISQLTVANGAGVARVTVSEIERGRTIPSVAVLIAICDQLGVDPGTILREATQ